MDFKSQLILTVSYSCARLFYLMQPPSWILPVDSYRPPWLHWCISARGSPVTSNVESVLLGSRNFPDLTSFKLTASDMVMTPDQPFHHRSLYRSFLTSNKWDLIFIAYFLSSLSDVSRSNRSPQNHQGTFGHSFLNSLHERCFSNSNISALTTRSHRNLLSHSRSAPLPLLKEL